MKTKIIMTIMATVILFGCSNDPTKAKQAIENSGLTDVNIGNICLFCCGEKDIFKNTFTGKNINGKIVSGEVCSGFFKGYTIRFD